MQSRLACAVFSDTRHCSCHVGFFYQNGKVLLLRLNASHVGALTMLKLRQHASKYVCLLQTLLCETCRKAVKSL